MEPKHPIPVMLAQNLQNPFQEILKSGLKEIQEQKNFQDGAYYLEILAQKKKEILEQESLGVNSIVFLPAMFCLIERGEVFLNEKFNKYSLVELEGYKKFSQIIKDKMGGLIWNEEAKVLDQGTAPTLNFAIVKQILLNKDPSLLDVERKDFENKVSTHGQLLLEEAPDIPKVVLSSFQRSGNSMFRNLLEQTSGIVTGTDMGVYTPAVGQLLCYGFKGEGIVTSRNWITKTHFPDVSPISKVFSGSCVLVLVRNILDTVISGLEAAISQTMDLTFSNSISKDFPELWEQSLKWFVPYWKDTIQFWVDEGSEKKIPVYFLKYEEIVQDKERALKEAYSFILGVEQIDGTYLEQRIQAFLSSQKQGVHYNTRKQRDGEVKNSTHFSPAQMDYITELCRKQLLFLGYAQVEESDSIFKIKRATEEERLIYNGFKAFNERQKLWYRTNKQTLDSNNYKVNDMGKAFSKEFVLNFTQRNEIAFNSKIKESS